jgi:hypothetical protein
VDGPAPRGPGWVLDFVLVVSSRVGGEDVGGPALLESSEGRVMGDEELGSSDAATTDEAREGILVSSAVLGDEERDMLSEVWCVRMCSLVDDRGNRVLQEVGRSATWKLHTLEKALTLLPGVSEKSTCA